MILLLAFFQRHSTYTTHISGSCYFDPIGSLLTPIDSRSLPISRFILALIGTDSMIFREMSYDGKKNRIVLGLLLLVATTWAGISSSIFIARSVPTLQAWQVQMFSLVYCSVIYLIDMSIISATDRKAIPWLFRILTATTAAYLVAAPITIEIFKNEIKAATIDQINVGELTSFGDRKIKEDRQLLENREKLLENITLQRNNHRDDGTLAEIKRQAAIRAITIETEGGKKEYIKELDQWTTGSPTCDQQCRKFKATAETQERIRREHRDRAGEIDQQIEEVKLEIKAIEDRIKAAESQYKTLKTDNLIENHHQLVTMVLRDPIRGSLAIATFLTLLMIDLLVVLGKTIIDDRAYNIYRQQREQALIQDAANFGDRTRHRRR